LSLTNHEIKQQLRACLAPKYLNIMIFECYGIIMIFFTVIQSTHV
jgi:hypothetical protein